MIYVTSISKLRTLGDWRHDFDMAWAIVRNMSKPIDGVVQVPALAPAKSLFFKYLSYENSGMWTEDRFKEFFVEDYIKGIMNDNSAMHCLDALCQADRDGKKVLLLCYCGNEKTCHRSIVAGILRGLGCDVVGTTTDYTEYFGMFKAYCSDT